MSSTLSGWLQVGLLVAALAACYIPLGNYIAKIFTTNKHWRVERAIFKATGINPDVDQTWGQYLRSMLAFSAVSVLFLYGMQRLQGYLLSFVGPHMAAVPASTSFNTAVSFTTNTNWQNYSGESTMTYLTQMSGLAVQNFMSAAVGLVVAIAMIRGFVRSRTGTLGNFWSDVTHAVVRLLLPLSVLGAIVLMAGGAIDNFSAYHTVTTLAGAHQTMVGGPVASQEVIKEMGNNGGGFFNANSAHPFENPNPFTNIFEIFLLLLIPFSTAAGVRQDGQGQQAGLRHRRDHGGHLVCRGRPGSASSRRTPAPAAPRRSPRATPRRAPRSGSAHPPARRSPHPQR